MLSRSALLFGGGGRTARPYPLFYKEVNEKMSRTIAPRRMRVSAALWAATKSKFGGKNSAARVSQAMQLFNVRTDEMIKRIHDGNAVVATASVNFPAHKSAPTLKASPRKAVKSKTTKKKTATKAAATKKRSSQKPKKMKSRAPKRARKSKKGSKVSQASSTAAIRAAVMRRAKLAPTPMNTMMVARLVRIVESQRNLSPKRKVDMVVRLLKKRARLMKKGNPSVKKVAVKKAAPKRKASAKKKKSSTIKKKPATTKPKVTSDVTKTTSAPKKKKAPSMKKKNVVAKKRVAKKKLVNKKVSKKKVVNKKVAKKKVTKKSGKGSFVQFYSRMMHTGQIKPKGASKRVKKLWQATKSAPNFAARVKLGEQMLAGKANQPVKTVAKVKKVPAKKAVAAASAARKQPIKFTVPANYRKNPFAATYGALYPFIGGETTIARMKNIAAAWQSTQKPNDTRTPHQRIQAVADAMKRN